MKADTLGQERTKTLTGRASEPDLDGVWRQPFRPILFCDHRTQHRAGGSIGIPDWNFNQNRLPVLDGRTGQFDQKMIEFLVQFVILISYLSGNIVRRLLVKQLRNIDQSAFWVG